MTAQSKDEETSFTIDLPLS
ncbi:hypothetical protein [Enterococcus faecium]